MPPLTESQIRSIIRDEMSKNNYTQPRGYSHDHDGINSQKVKQSSLISSTRANGSITFSNTGMYTLNYAANSNISPTSILCYGSVFDSLSNPTVRAHTMGSAQLGQSLYFQPSTTSSVVTGGPVQPFVQSSSYIAVLNSGNTSLFHANTSEEHLVSVEYSGIHARMTLVSFNTTQIVLNVDNLDSGWSIVVNIVVI